MKLENLILVVYCAEISTIKVLIIECPPFVHQGMVIGSEYGTVQIEKLVWNEPSLEMTALCGLFVYINGSGELGGSRMYFPFGHVPKELFEGATQKMWQTHEETPEQRKLMFSPVIICRVPETSSDAYIVP